MQFKLSPLALSFVAVLIAGFMYAFTKVLMSAGLTCTDVGAIRQIGTALMLIPVLLVVDRNASRINLRDLPMFILFALFNVVSNVTIFKALDYISMGLASVLQMMNPYFVLVLALLLFNIKVTVRKIVACMVAFTGCVCILGLFEEGTDFSTTGVMLGVISSVTLAAFTVGGRFVGDRGYSENTAMLYFFGLSGLMFIPIADLGNIGSVLIGDLTLLADALCLCFVCTLVINFLIIYVTRRMDPGVFSIIFASNVVASTIIGIIFFGESVTLLGVFGIALVLSAMVVLEFDSVRKMMKERRV